MVGLLIIVFVVFPLGNYLGWLTSRMSYPERRPWNWRVLGTPLLYGPWLKRTHPDIAY